MKRKILLFSSIACVSYGVVCAQATTYGNNAGMGGGVTNSYFGAGAGQNNTGTGNTFVGNVAGISNTLGESNVSIGYLSGFNNDQGNENTFIGTDSGSQNTEGNNNTFIGFQSGQQNTLWDNNTFLGHESGLSHTSGSENTFLGAQSGRNGSGNDNTYVGFTSGFNSSGLGNTFVGYESGYSNNANFNTFIGYHSGRQNTTGQYNAFLGDRSGEDNTTGQDNTFIGVSAGWHTTTGAFNTFLGSSSGSNNNGSENVFIGFRSGLANTVGVDNTFLGSRSGRSNTEGYSNTFLGSIAGRQNTTGYSNTFLGSASGYNNQTGSGNVFLGSSAGYNEMGSNLLYIDNSSTSSPLIWGDFANDALRFNGTVQITNIPNNNALDQVLVMDNNGNIHQRDAATLGSDNLGNHQVLQNLVPDTDNTYNLGGNGAAFSNIYFDSSLYINDTEFLHTRDNNVAIGPGALSVVAGGSQNVAIGENAMMNNTTGSNNTAIGYNTNTGIGLTNATAIGNGASASSSNRVAIGNSSVTRIGGYTNWFIFSDGRFKKNVQEDIPGLKFIEKLRPVSYEMDHPKLQAFLGEEQTTVSSQSSKRYVGFIAQEVAQMVDENRYTFSGVERPQNEKDYYGIRYAEFVVPLVKGMQEQQQIIEALQQRIEDLESLITATGTSLPKDGGTQTKSAGFEGLVLYQNIPNPFNQTTTITAVVPDQVQQAKIIIYNLQGLELESYPIPDRESVSVEISAGHFPSGMYLYALLADGQVIDTKKMILTR